jgi:hypothetical protein
VLSIIPLHYLKNQQNQATHRRLFPDESPSLHLLDGIYNNMAQYTDSHFYSDHVALCLVEDISKATDLDAVLAGDIWMVGLNKDDLPQSVLTKLKKTFPNHIYTDDRDGVIYCWEWVSG